MIQDPSQEVRVLFVEDAIDQALLVKAFFNTMSGYSVTHAQDGEAALRLIARGPWDLLVTDLNLPGADGFEVIRAFRSKLANVPILVTTGYTQPEYEEQALRAGANHVAIKPLNQEEFVSRVRSMVERIYVPVPLERSVVIALEARLGDTTMGCGGTLMAAAEAHQTVVVIPICSDAADVSPEELKGATIAADILGVELRVDRTLFGNMSAQKDLLERTLNELRPGKAFIPSLDDRDPSRSAVARLAMRVTSEVETVLAYETATTGLDFAPTQFVDIHHQLVLKMEALAAYQAVGAGRIDLRPRMAQAYARYWGRFMDFAEVEAFYVLREAAEERG